jgi:inner membrane protein
MFKNPRTRIIIKSVVIFILILFLIIPTAMIDSLVYERQSRQSEAFNEVSSKWAFNQTITGPIVSIPYYEVFKDTSGRVYKTRKHIHILPDELTVNGRLFPEKRYRSIYEVIVYNSKLNLSGNFSKLTELLPAIPKEHMLFDESFITLGISDLRGIEEQVKIKWDASEFAFNSGVPTNDIVSSGITAKVPLHYDSIHSKTTFHIAIELKGSEMIQFTPIGKETKVSINSNWKNPSFDGAFLPDERVVADTGFSAYWKVLHLNRNYPQKWQNDQYNLTESNFGIKLIVPTDSYLKTDRAIKYAMLFIALTFLIYFFLELLNNISVHPFQYILIGFALCLFYVLLLSISEHLPFNWAYLIASVLTLGLIYWYSKSILKENKLSALVGGTLMVLYLFIFIIIQMEDYALLIGSIGLFIILAIVMYYSKKIDWQNLGGPPEEQKTV